MSSLHKMAALAWAVGIMSGMTFLLFAQKAPAPGDKVIMSPGTQPAGVPTPDRKNIPSPDAAPGNAPKEAADRSFDFNAMSTKRDPFKSLIKKNEVVVDASPEAVKRPAGIRGTLVSELRLIGLAKGLGGERLAILVGPDQKAHFMRSGDRVWDGVLQEMDDSTVVFSKETKRGSGASRKQETVKMYLYPPIQQ